MPGHKGAERRDALPCSMMSSMPGLHMRVEKDGTAQWWRLGLLVCLTLLLYGSTLTGLWEIWWSRDTYAHGLLVPFISLYLIWNRRRRLCALQPEPEIIAGLLGMLLSLAMLMGGEAGGILALGGLSLIGMLASMTLLLFGRPYLRALAYPITYLVFMVPVLDLLIKPLQLPAQVVTASMAVSMLHAIGIPTFREGIYIHLPQVVAEVAPGCSGLNFLVSILAVGIPLASVTLSSMWSRVILVASGVAIAIMANWVRVALIGLHNYFWGGALYGPLHLFQAMAVDWVGFIGLLAGAWVLSSVESRGATADLSPTSSPMVSTPVRWHGAGGRAWAVAAIALSLASVLFWTFDRGPVEPAQDLSLIPTRIGEWTAVPSMSDRPLLVLDAVDHALIRTYRDPQGRRIDLYVGYLNAQQQGRELVNFDARFDRLHRMSEERSEKIRELVFVHNRGAWSSRDGTRPMLFWYEIGGRAYAGRYAAKWATIIQALGRGGSHGAFILLSGPAMHEGDQDGAELLSAFAGVLLPFLRESVAR